MDANGDGKVASSPPSKSHMATPREVDQVPHHQGLERML